MLPIYECFHPSFFFIMLLLSSTNQVSFPSQEYSPIIMYFSLILQYYYNTKVMEVVKQLGLAFGADWDSFGSSTRKSSTWQPPSGKALTQTEHKQAVTRATTAINELQTQLIDLLDVRSRSFGELKEFDKALEDASVHILQDRYDEAICTYQKGLSMIPKTDNPGHKRLKALVENAENTLDKRAAEHAKRGDFEGGLSIARELVYAAPQSAKGFLRAGEIYCMQGKSNLAVEIYEQGLESLSSASPSTEDSRYNLLAEERVKALAQAETQVDFLGTLPFEILAYILPLLSTAELVECGSVCHRWRERVIQCNEAWREVTLKCSDDIILVSPVTAHIRKLWLNLLEDWELEEFLDKMVIHGNIRHLDSFAIESGVQLNPAFCMDVILQSQSGYSLTELYISIDTLETVPILGYVLSECPNLTHLTYEAPDFDRIINTAPLPDQCNITHLRLNTFLDTLIHRTELEPILNTCPELRCLIIDRCAPSALQAVHQVCPNVYYLHYGSHDDDIFDIGQLTPWDWPVIPKNTSKATAGARYISIAAEDAKINRRDVIALLNKNTTTLEDVHLNVRLDESRFIYTPVWEPLNVYGGERLRKFECTLGCRTSVLASIFYRSPALETILIQDMHYVTDAIFTSLVDLPNLKCLRLVDCPGLSEDGLVSFFEKMTTTTSSQQQNAKKRISSTSRHHYKEIVLEEFEFADMPSMTDHSLNTLLNIKSLRKLSLTRCNSVTGIGLNEFMDKMRDHSVSGQNDGIEELNFMQMDAVTDLTLCALGAIEGLKRVKLSLLNGVTDRGLVSLACDFENYEHINGTSTIVLRRS
ncbi:hypothetical protein BDA99DRAFT_573912 [Phascolomyces articulosus]|uniref:F-box domain-containing protein n=1 Tax=Phascolomyces articulosus TaxID=60185 RepID=A0AAD5PBN9_9FUNG|nr:hypothetical protein BDA99DRAFT_573912 [Phascolomyces articulosus]